MINQHEATPFSLNDNQTKKLDRNTQPQPRPQVPSIRLSLGPAYAPRFVVLGSRPGYYQVEDQ